MMRPTRRRIAGALVGVVAVAGLSLASTESASAATGTHSQLRTAKAEHTTKYERKQWREKQRELKAQERERARTFPSMQACQAWRAHVHAFKCVKVAKGHVMIRVR